MKYTVKLLTVALTLFTIGACTDLEEEIKDGFTKDFDPNNPGVGVSNNVNKAQPQDGLAAAFGRLFGGTAGHNGYFSLQEVSTDEAVITQKGGDWFDGGIWLDMHRHQWTSTHPALNNFWNTAYGAINECNRLIADGQNAAGEAQLRTLRAYWYWRLMDSFGRVKIVTAPGVDAPQATKQEVFNFIEAELLASIPNLPSGRQEYGRVSDLGAQAFLSRLYLNAEAYIGTPRYADAIAAADVVINSGVYSLTDDYAAVFGPANVDDPEHIWVVPFDEQTGGGMNFSQMTLHYPSQLTYRLAEQPWNGYSTLEEFYNSYSDANDERQDNNFVVGPQFDVSGAPILDLAFDTADPDGAPINYTPAINELAPNGSRQAGARMGKFSFKLKGRSNMDNDYPLFRYAEVLMNKAEAQARLTANWSDATTLMLVNQIRTRAGAATFSSLDANEFLAERGREFFQESLRRMDLIRFDRWGAAWWEKPAHSDDFRDVFPIPNEQILSANGTLTQNTGYN